MIVGAGLYAEVYPWVKANILNIGNIGKATLPSMTGWSAWWFILALFVLAMGIFNLIARLEQKKL